MRVALYARVSTEEQALHGLSIDAQLAALREAYPNGQEYVDLGISARKPISKRPELQRLLRDVEQGKVDLVAFTKLDRWTRNIREYYKCQDILDSHNVPWKALHEDYETLSANGRLKVNLMLAISQDEADRTSERIKAVFERKRQKGLVASGSVPLGVRVVDGQYAPSEDANIVKQLFDDYIANRSVQMTAKKYGRTGNGIRLMIKNETYLKTGIIDKATFTTANEILKSRSQRHVRSDRVYLFSGLILCPYCGCKMTCAHSYNDNIYYRCPHHYDGNCPGIHVPEKALEKYLLDQLIPYVKDYNLTIRKMKKKSVDVNALKKKRDKLTDLYMDDLIDKVKYESDFKSLTTAIEEAERQPKEMDTEEIKTVLEAYKGLSPLAKKAFWSNLIKSITPTKDGYIFTVNYT